MVWETATPRPDPRPDPRREFPWTVASFDSECPGCGFDIEEVNDDVFLVEELGGWVCESCARGEL